MYIIKMAYYFVAAVLLTIVALPLAIALRLTSKTENEKKYGKQIK